MILIAQCYGFTLSAFPSSARCVAEAFWPTRLPNSRSPVDTVSILSPPTPKQRRGGCVHRDKINISRLLENILRKIWTEVLVPKIAFLYANINLKKKLCRYIFPPCLFLLIFFVWYEYVNFCSPQFFSFDNTSLKKNRVYHILHSF